VAIARLLKWQKSSRQTLPNTVSVVWARDYHTNSLARKTMRDHSDVVIMIVYSHWTGWTTEIQGEQGNIQTGDHYRPGMLVSILEAL